MYLTHPNSRQTKVSAGDYEGKYILHPKTLSKNQAVYMQYTYQNYSIRHLAHAEYEHWILGTDTLESILPGLLGTFWKKYKVDTGSTYLLKMYLFLKIFL